MTANLASQGMAKPSFLRRLQILEPAEMLMSRKAGRFSVYTPEPKRLIEAKPWMEKHHRMVKTRLDQRQSSALAFKELNQ